MSAAITHTSRCDLSSCRNFDISFDVWTIGGQVYSVFCAACDRDITHTCVPKE